MGFHRVGSDLLLGVGIVLESLSAMGAEIDRLCEEDLAFKFDLLGRGHIGCADSLGRLF